MNKHLIPLVLAANLMLCATGGAGEGPIGDAPAGIKAISSPGPLPDKFLFAIGAQAAVGELRVPKGVVAAPDGTVYVADTLHHRIQHFTAAGTFLSGWGSYGSSDGQFWWPVSVAVAADGSVYVADWFNYRIQHFSATGAFLGKLGSYGHGDGQFFMAASVAVAPDGTVYEADTDADRIQAFGVAYPTTWRGEFFANRWLAERPTLIQEAAALDFDWGTGSPGAGVPTENFSARFHRYAWCESATYHFTVTADDGVRLWVDEVLLIEQWRDNQGATFRADLALSQGYHRLRVEYYDASGRAMLRLEGAPPYTPTPTATPSATLTPTATRTGGAATATPTATPTATRSATATTSPTRTRTPAATRSATPSATLRASPSPTGTPTVGPPARQVYLPLVRR